MDGMNLLKLAGAAVIGGGISIGSQLIVAYLKQRNGDKPICQNSTVTLSDCREKRMEFAGWKSEVDKILVQQRGNIAEHAKSLDKGNKDFEAIKKDISGINTSLAVFAEKLKKEGG